MDQPDTITVHVSHQEEVRAIGVEVHLSVAGTSFITGDAALKKAKEVSQLVDGLMKVGIKSESIALRGIQAASSTGILGRATSATYLLRINCDDLERLADILGVVTAQKNVTLSELVWRFPDDESARTRWLETCLVEAQAKARRIAASLGIKLLGVHSLTEESDANERTGVLFGAEGTRGMALKARPRSIDLGFALATTKRVTVGVEVNFRVSGY